MSSLVRVLTNTGKSVKHFTVDALTGKYYDRLLRVPGIKNLEVSDPDLEANLTDDELRRMREKFPYLAPKERKPEPLPLGESVAAVDENIETIAVHVDDLPDFIETMEGIGATVELSSPSSSPIPVEVILENLNDTKEQPQAAKRGRKPKQA